MNPIQAFTHCIKNYKNFSGRATRSEFWWWTLLSFPAMLLALTPFSLLVALSSKLFGNENEVSHFTFILMGIPVLIILIFFFCASLSVTIRRLRDAGYSPWFLLILCIPYLGPIFILFWCIEPSEPTHIKKYL